RLRTGLVAMSEAIEPGARVTRVRRLGGGLGASTLAVDIRTHAGRLVPVVLKQYLSGGSDACREWRGLQFARELGVQSPKPLALDNDGHWFHTPALVMTRLR